MKEREPEPDVNTPHYLPEGARSKYWDIAKKCTSKNSEDRPLMSDVAYMLGALCDSVQGRYYYHYYYFISPH